MSNVFIRSAYNYESADVSAATAVFCDPKDCMVQKHFAEECDINTIVKRFGLTHQLPVTFKAPLAGDFADVVDFQTAMNAVVAAQNSFMEMPAELRARFGHDPQRLLDFLEDSNNKEEAIKLGLIPAPVEKTRDVVQAVDELAKQLVPRETK